MSNSKAKNMNTAIKRNDAAVRFDNHWRQNLGIGDPNDPEEFAKGLLKEYAEDAIEIEIENSGAPHGSMVIDQVTVSDGSASSEEAERAVDDIERDLRTLTQDSNLKDIDVELGAWGRAIRRIAADGINSAQYALDPRHRDRAYAARRGLGDYARLARYVGALTKNSNQDYRQLAQSIDVVASLILVLMGEAQAEAGVRSGQFLLQVPAAELQARRDAALNALRALTGSVSATSDNFDYDQTWPRGLEAYRQFCAYLDQAGLTDLRSLCDEHSLAQQLNELVDMASGGTQDGLRSLGATWHTTVIRIQRLLFAAQAPLARPESPVLARFLSALALFIEGFDNGSAGSRLLYVARPPILLYGHYGIGALDNASRTLQNIVNLRGQLAEDLDCYLACECDVDHVVCQVLLDKILFDTDRAIDHYTIGSDPDGYGPPEHRAAGYGAVIEAFLSQHPQCLGDTCNPLHVRIVEALAGLQNELGWNPRTIPQAGDVDYDSVVCRMHSEICMQLRAERVWEDLVRRMVPSCRQSLLFPGDGQPSVIEGLLENDAPAGALNLIRALIAVPEDEHPCSSCDITALIPPTLETSFERITDAVSRTGLGRIYRW